MAQNDMELENEESAGKFERFLFLMVPIIFTLVLIGVLLTLFNMDYRNGMLQLANKIPIVNQWVPDPEEKADGTDQQSESSEATIRALKAQLSQQQETIQQLNEQKTEQDKQVQALKSQADEIQQAQAMSTPEPAETEDDHEKEIAAMTKLYAGMKASKAAVILQNMTTDEVVQLLSGMSNDSKAAILEKMDPKVAADVSIKLKESANSSDMAIAALQSRLNQDSAAASSASSGNDANLDKEKLKQTFSSMPAAEAAKLLNEMYSISPDKVITILNTVGDTVRSSILSEMTKNDTNGVTAKIVNRLMGGK